MLKIAVCDDDAVFLENTVEMINKWSTLRDEKTEIHTFSNGDDLIEGHKNVQMDIIFLDVIMPLLNGMDTARELRQNDNSVSIVFTTSSPEFAVESYEVKAQNYLLKPVSDKKIQAVLDEALLLKNHESKSVVFKTSFGYHRVFIDDLEYVEAQNKKVAVYLKDGSLLESPESLHRFEEQTADCPMLFKCHRSYIVNLANVDSFSSVKIVCKSGRSIPIARGCAKEFKEAYFKVMFNE